jgi:hypothetical protein
VFEEVLGIWVNFLFLFPQGFEDWVSDIVYLVTTAAFDEGVKRWKANYSLALSPSATRQPLQTFKFVNACRMPGSVKDQLGSASTLLAKPFL